MFDCNQHEYDEGWQTFLNRTKVREPFFFRVGQLLSEIAFSVDLYSHRIWLEARHIFQAILSLRDFRWRAQILRWWEPFCFRVGQLLSQIAFSVDLYSHRILFEARHIFQAILSLRDFRWRAQILRWWEPFFFRVGHLLSEIAFSVDFYFHRIWF